MLLSVFFGTNSAMTPGTFLGRGFLQRVIFAG
jgi:hypothetical protein